MLCMKTPRPPMLKHGQKWTAIPKAKISHKDILATATAAANTAANAAGTAGTTGTAGTAGASATIGPAFFGFNAAAAAAADFEKKFFSGKIFFFEILKMESTSGCKFAFPF